MGTESSVAVSAAVAQPLRSLALSRVVSGEGQKAGVLPVQHEGGLPLKLSSKQEFLCWLAACIAAASLFFRSHTFNVVRGTYYYGAGLLCVLVFLLWLRFRKEVSPRPRWLKIVANFVLVIVSTIFVIYALGVATWYE